MSMQSETLVDGSSIPVLGLGTWQMGGASTADYSQDKETIATLEQLIGMGYTHLDTAEVYGATHSEDLVGAAAASYPRDTLFITTKVSPQNLGYDSVHRALEGSLKRLAMDYVDLYLIHWPNPDIPLNETFRALNELVADGRIRYLGVSNFNVPLLREAMDLAATPIVTNQVLYNLLRREPLENGLLDFCRQHDILLTAYSPLKHGVLDNSTVQQIAREHDATPAQVAIAWLVQQPKVITIPKTSSVARGIENLDALKLNLNADERKALDGLYTV
jgi:diketogulonate reductase-like aldo/keto reductase